MNESERRWRVYRVTFDTNIFLRALIRRGNLANNLLSLWLDGRLVLVLSQDIVDEVSGSPVTTQSYPKVFIHSASSHPADKSSDATGNHC